MKDTYILYTHKLEGEYADTFKQIEFYCNTIVMDETTREEHLSEVLDMFLNAQKSGKSVKKIVGSDVTWFCKEFCSDIDLKSKVKSFADRFKNLIWGLLILSGLDFIVVLIDIMNGLDVSLLSGNSSDIIKYALGLVALEVFMFLFNLVVISIVHRFNKIPTKGQRLACSISGLIIGIIAYGITMVFIPEFQIPTLIVCTLCGAYLAMYYIIRHKEERFQTSIFDINDDNQAQFNIQIINEYHSKNRKLMKTGKEIQTPDEFMKKYRKMINKSKLHNLSYLPYPLSIVISCFLIEFESVPDMIFFILLLAVIEFFIFKFFYKAEKDLIEKIKSFIKLYEDDPTIFEQIEEED